ncbi:PEP-CTERM sorting domain-containing protein [Chromatium okenii]|uniref:PEP-CTERM sorting domain-containing protein n=1 Tax=Chromatium okenii TaxID=61644 RepID=UPI0026F2E0F0|nr:PEP-CTERM sorting domain-containing protein [Chromatium okenii]MBV5309400.1 PEP-CTERM sorting domain-containing protein [Chromatium okenii]
MKRTLIALSCLLSTTMVQANVVTFEDSTVGAGDALSAGYSGFNWGDTYLADESFGVGYLTGSASGSKAAYGSQVWGSNIQWANTDTFNFVGAYWTISRSTASIRFEGFNDGVRLFQNSNQAINSSSPTWIELNWSGIDQLKIYQTGVNPWVMDDFTYNIASSGAVPEPATLALLTLGLTGMGVARRRKSHTA